MYVHMTSGSHKTAPKSSQNCQPEQNLSLPANWGLIVLKDYKVLDCKTFPVQGQHMCLLDAHINLAIRVSEERKQKQYL